MAYQVGENPAENQFHLAEKAYRTNEGLDSSDINEGHFTSLVNRAMLFANIPEKELPYYQKQFANLTQMFKMAKTDPSFAPTFVYLYYRIYNKLNLTKAVNGKGMDNLVAMAIGKPGGPQYAFNPYEELQKQEKEQRGFFDALLKPKQQPQQQPR